MDDGTGPERATGDHLHFSLLAAEPTAKKAANKPPNTEVEQETGCKIQQPHLPDNQSELSMQRTTRWDQRQPVLGDTAAGDPVAYDPDPNDPTGSWDGAPWWERVERGGHSDPAGAARWPSVPLPEVAFGAGVARKRRRRYTLSRKTRSQTCIRTSRDGRHGGQKQTIQKTW